MESERSWQIAARGALANPLDTEERWFGSWNFNSAGVQNYPDQATGIAASVATITNGDYPELLAALRSQASSSVVCAAVCASPWGSKPTPQVLADVIADYGTIANTEVAGTPYQAPIPAPTPPKPPSPPPLPPIFLTDLGIEVPAMTSDEATYIVQGWYIDHLGARWDEPGLAYWSFQLVEKGLSYTFSAFMSTPEAQAKLGSTIMHGARSCRGR